MDRGYYVPIALAAFWFGSRGSIAVGLVSVLLYAPHIAQFEFFGSAHAHHSYGNKYAEAVLFPLFGLFVGRLIDLIRAKTASLSGAYNELLESHESAQRSARLALVGQIAAGLAHEIRNPLAGLHGAVEALGDRIPNEDDVSGDFLQRSLTEIERINELVTDFLAFGRPSPVERAPVRLAELVSSVAALLATQAKERSVRIEVCQDEDLPEIMLDANKIKQSLLNLMLNGIQAMDDGGTLTVTVRQTDGAATITVRDEGSGIPAENLENVFAPFVSTKGHGSGLGLPMARQIAESHGGTLSLESSEGQGATCVMCLPVQERKDVCS
jgi:signal transduction histidine kinase